MRALATFVVVLCAVVVLGSEWTFAAPAPPCVFGVPESLRLMPAGGVTHRGLIVQRDPNDGLYRTDAGQVFDVESGTVTADAVTPSQCSQFAETVTVTVLDPFEGPDAGARTFTLAVMP